METNVSEEEINRYKEIFQKEKKVNIIHFFKLEIAEMLYKHVITEKNWTLATGIDKNKFEKPVTNANEKINNLQIKNVNTAFGRDQFTYIFYRSMNNQPKSMSYIEFLVRKTFRSPSFIDLLNKITNVGISQLTTLFLSKYKSGNFLSPHSDKGNGRLAFVLNLTKEWKPQYGGLLHFMSHDRTQITETIVPHFNQLFLFHVPEEVGISHFVSAVAPNVRISRYAITGWFS